jgi:hypothetical protein
LTKIFICLIIACVAVLINVPMGYWRTRVRKYSLGWFLAIHLSIPLIFVLRIKSGLGYGYIPELFLAAIAGQVIGGKLDNTLG